MKKYLINSLVASVLVSSAAFAQDETESVDVTAQVEDHKSDDRRLRGNHDESKRHHNRGRLLGRILRIIDTDEDGQVSIDEYMAHAQTRFTDMDLDGNNFVTSEEAKQAAEIMRERQRSARSVLNDRKKESETE